MEKSEIKDKIKNINSLTDFSKLLDDIKSEEFKNINKPITEGLLKHYSYDKIVPNRYRAFHIHKKNGKLREINAPCYQLSIILHILNILFKSLYVPKSSVMGFTEGRSVVMNASLHNGHHYVFNIDLQDFFSSVPQARVWARLQQPPFNFPLKVANIVAGLCCHVNADGTRNVLPQGAPTSPLLTNAICDRLDYKMLALAKKFGLHYSRYADDMSFSSMRNVYQDGSDFRIKIKRIIEEEGFKMNESKTRLLRDGKRQEVTGLIVNEKVNLTKKYVKDLRCLLHVWEKDGYEKAYAYFYPIYKKEKGYIKKGEPIMENVIGGKLNYMRMVKGEGNAAYKKLNNRFNKLQNVIYVDTETDRDNSYAYVCSYSMKAFEEYFHTSLSLEMSPKQKIIGKCRIGGIDKVIPVSKSTQAHLCENYFDFESSSIAAYDKLANCFVSLCRNKGKNFWLITKEEMKRSRCLSILNANVDVDELLEIWDKEGINIAAKIFKQSIVSKEILMSSKDENKIVVKGVNKNKFKSRHADYLNPSETIEPSGDSLYPDIETIYDLESVDFSDADLNSLVEGSVKIGDGVTTLE